MGYTTEFSGKFKVKPNPLDEKMVEYLKLFSQTRRMKRRINFFGIEGEFYVYGTGFMGQEIEENVIDSNSPPETQPSLWCQWVPTSDGAFIVWDGGEKFYNYIEWIKYIEENFLAPFGKYLEGDVIWQGEDIMDRGRIIADKDIIKVVEDNGSERSVMISPRNLFKNNIDAILGFENKRTNSLRIAMDELSIPLYMHEGIENYINKGIGTGDFLKSVIQNKLVQSFAKADGYNKSKINEYATLLFNYFPEDSWGGEEAYKNWIKKGGLEGVEK